MTRESKKDFIINVMFAVSILAICLLISKVMLAYLFPFIIGVCIALAVQKPALYFSGKTGIKKTACAVLLTVLICILVLAGLFFGIWALGEKLMSYLSETPEYISNLQTALKGIENRFISTSSSRKDAAALFNGAVGSITSAVSNFISGVAAGIIKNLPAFLIGSIVTVVASCYIAKDFDRLKRFVTNLLSAEKAKMLTDIKNVFCENCLKFIRGYGIIGAITFAELTVVFLILGVDKPVFKALMLSLIDALPVLGVGTVIIPWSVIELLKTNYFLGLGLVAGYSIIIILRNFLEPKIIGEQIGINPIFTLISMFVGLKTSGFAGMIIFPLSLTVIIDYYKKTMKIENQITASSPSQ